VEKEFYTTGQGKNKGYVYDIWLRREVKELEGLVSNIELDFLVFIELFF